MPKVLNEEERRRLQELEKQLREADQAFQDINLRRKFLIGQIFALKGRQLENILRRTNCRDTGMTPKQLAFLKKPVGLVFTERTNLVLMDLGVFDVEGLERVSEAEILGHLHSNSDILREVKGVLAKNNLPELRMSDLQGT